MNKIIIYTTEESPGQGRNEERICGLDLGAKKENERSMPTFGKSNAGENRKYYKMEK